MTNLQKIRNAAQRIDPAQGFYANRTHFQLVAALIAEPYRAIYERLNGADQLDVLQMVSDEARWTLIGFDTEFGWNFGQTADRDRIPDAAEKYLIGVFGASYARYYLTGALKLIL